MKNRFPVGKFGLKINPIGEYVALQWEGRTILGEVTSIRRDEVCGTIRAHVKHFNGVAWPVEPSIGACEWIQQ